MANLLHCYRHIKMEYVLLIIHGCTVNSGDYKDRVTLVIICDVYSIVFVEVPCFMYSLMFRNSLHDFSKISFVK
jgi:hypothetical protein